MCGSHLFSPPHRRVLLTWNNSQHGAVLRDGLHARLNDIYMRLTNSVWKKKFTSNRSPLPNCEWTQTKYSNKIIIGINSNCRFNCYGYQQNCIKGIHNWKEIWWNERRSIEFIKKAHHQLNENIKVNLTWHQKNTPLFHKELRYALCKRIIVFEYAGFKFDILWRYKIGNNDEPDSIYSTIVVLKIKKYITQNLNNLHGL